MFKLINTPLYKKITNKEQQTQFSSKYNCVIQYVNYSSSIIASDDITTLNKYADCYFKILEGFYNLNKLLINVDKTKLLITCKPKYRCSTHNITL